MTKRTITWLLAPALLSASVLGLVACGDDPPASDGIATLGGEVDDASSDGETADGGAGPRDFDETEFQDAMLEFTECMRDHGVDMPDPQFDGGGGPGGGVVVAEVPRGTGPRIDPESEVFQEADEACRPIMEDVAPDIELTPEEEAEMRDQALAFAECMRDHGVDMPDPQFGEDGGVSISVGSAGDADPAERRPDFEDPAFEAAMEECRGDGFGVFGGDGPRVDVDRDGAAEDDE